MKKQIRKAMICTIAMMVAAVISLTGVTYAWFSESMTATVSGINLGIESKDGGVLMSAVPDARDTDWNYGVNINWTGTNFKPASTTHSNLDLKTGLLTFYRAELGDKLYLVKPTALTVRPYNEHGEDQTGDVVNGNVGGGYYIQKSFYLWNVENGQITVQLGATISAQANKELKNADQAMRIAILDHGTYTMNGTSVALAKAEGKDPTKDDIYSKDDLKIYEPNALSHHRGGTGYIDTYGITAAASDFVNLCTDTTSEGYNTSEIKIYKTNAAAPGLHIEKTNTSHANEGDPVGTLAGPTFTIAAKSRHMVTVFIWLEGQDNDCTNEISGSDLAINVTFTKQ